MENAVTNLKHLCRYAELYFLHNWINLSLYPVHLSSSAGDPEYMAWLYWHLSLYKLRYLMCCNFMGVFIFNNCACPTLIWVRMPRDILAEIVLCASTCTVVMTLAAAGDCSWLKAFFGDSSVHVTSSNCVWIVYTAKISSDQQQFVMNQQWFANYDVIAIAHIELCNRIQLVS